jgi:hypothetical protein
MSYNGQLNFGLTADFDALADVETLVDELTSAIDELVGAAGAQVGGPRRAVPKRRPRALHVAE